MFGGTEFGACAPAAGAAVCGAQAKYCCTFVTTTGCQTTCGWAWTCTTERLDTGAGESVPRQAAVPRVRRGDEDWQGIGVEDCRMTSTCEAAAEVDGGISILPRCNCRLPKDILGEMCCSEPTEEGLGLRNPSNAALVTVAPPPLAMEAPSLMLMLPREDCCGVSVDPTDHGMDSREAEDAA